MLKIPTGAPASRGVALLGRSMGVNLTTPVRISIVLRTSQSGPALESIIRRLGLLWPNPQEIEILPTPTLQQEVVGAGRRSWRFPFLRNPAATRPDNTALAQARGQFVVLLDEQTLPTGTALRDMMERFRNDPRLGAAVFCVVNTDGTPVRPEFPEMVLGCATAFRRRALDLAGFFPQDLLTPAAECDLSLRLLEQGWRIKRFDDLHAVRIAASLESQTTPAMEAGDRLQLETCEELMLIARRFPWRWMLPYATDWMRRRQWIAQRDRHYARFRAGLLEGLLLSACSLRNSTSEAGFESMTGMMEIERRLRQETGRLGLRRIVLIDYGPNLYAYYRAARRCGLRIVAIADDTLAMERRRYRNIPVLAGDATRHLKFDAGIVTRPAAFGPARRMQWMRTFTRPLLDLLDPRDQAATPSLQPPAHHIAGRIRPGDADRAAKAARRIAARSA